MSESAIIPLAAVFAGAWGVAIIGWLIGVVECVMLHLPLFPPLARSCSFIKVPTFSFYAILGKHGFT